MSDCYLCGHSPARVTFSIDSDVGRVECPSCGEYTISQSIRLAIENRPKWDEQRPIIASAARRRFAANEPLNLNTETDWLEALRAESAQPPAEMSRHQTI